MKLKFENLGVIKSGEIDLSKELIILTGRNNTGKSYVSYLLYGLYRNWDNESKSEFYKFVYELIEIPSNFPNLELIINLNKHFDVIINKLLVSFETNLKDSLFTIFASKNINPIISLSKEECLKIEDIKTTIKTEKLKHVSFS